MYSDIDIVILFIAGSCLYITFSTVTFFHKRLPLKNISVREPITPKYFFDLDNSLHSLKPHCAFFTEVLTFFYVVKVTKSSHHLSHDRASKRHGSIPCLMSQLDLHLIKSL